MQFSSLLRVSAALLALFAVLPAQTTNSLTSTYAGGNGCSGNFFDVVTTNDVQIDSFDVSIDSGQTTDVEVWAVTGGGTHVGIEGAAAAWTLLATATGVTSAGQNVPTPLNLNLNYCIPAARTQGFFIRTTAGTVISYTNGTAVGNVVASDGNLSILEGRYTCNLAGFGATSAAAVRVWNGTIHYTTGITCPPFPPSEWQINQTGASLDINGVAQLPGGPIRVEVAAGSNDTVNVQSANVGLPWDMAITPGVTGNALSSGGFGTPGGQTVNIAFASPTLTWLNTGLPPTVPFAGNLSLPVSVPVMADVSAQTIHVDPTHLDGFALSALNEYVTVTCDPSSNFDTLQTGTNLPIAWTNASNGNVAWTVNSGGTSSSNTGPTGAFSGTNYLYCETSGSGGTSTFSFDTCPGDLANFPNFTGTLNFQLSRIGASIGTLNIYLDDGSGTFSTLLATYTGPDANQSQGGVEWSAESVSFLPTTQFFAFRFEYTAGGTFTGDIALDDIVAQ